MQKNIAISKINWVLGLKILKDCYIIIKGQCHIFNEIGALSFSALVYVAFASPKGHAHLLFKENIAKK